MPRPYRTNTPQLRLLTTREAAEALALSPRTLEAFRLRGNGPDYIRIGTSPRGAVRYREADLLAWIEGGAR